MRKRGDLSYIVGCMRFSGYLRQARYGYDGNSFGEQVIWRSWLTFCVGQLCLFKQSIQRASTCEKSIDYGYIIKMRVLGVHGACVPQV